MEKGIPEASREILMGWQKQGLFFGFDGRTWGISDPAFIFDDITQKYSIPAQPIPAGLTVEQVEVMWGQGLRLEFNCGADKKPDWKKAGPTFGWRSGYGGVELLNHLRIPEQPIPAKLLGEQPVAKGWTHEQAQDPAGKETEYDPLGTDPHSPGAKLDAGKNRLGLVLGGFAKALEEVGKVGTYGAEKYSPNGWKSVPDGKDRYTDAMLRHWLINLQGEKIDPTTGLMHQAQLVWNALAVLELMLKENKDG